MDRGRFYSTPAATSYQLDLTMLHHSGENVNVLCASAYFSICIMPAAMPGAVLDVVTIRWWHSLPHGGS